MTAVEANPALNLILRDCCQEAEEAGRQLAETVQCLLRGNHLGALGALSGIDDRLQYVRVVLVHADRITRRSRKVKPGETARKHKKKGGGINDGSETS